MSTNYYTILGVSQNATAQEIKSAYRKLARELHPDINPDPAAAERFKKITLAYNKLINPAKSGAGFNTHEDSSAGNSSFRDHFTTSAKLKSQALYDALRHQEWDLAQALLVQSDVVPDEDTMNYAAINLHESWMALMIARGGTVEPYMLYNACISRNFGAAQVMLEASKVVPDEDTMNYAATSLHESWMKLMIARGGVVEPYMLYNACISRNFGAAQVMLEQSKVVPDEDTMNYAATNLHESWIALMIACGGKVEPYMLHNALRAPRLAVAQVMLENSDVVPDRATLVYASRALHPSWTALLLNAVKTAEIRAAQQGRSARARYGF